MDETEEYVKGIDDARVRHIREIIRAQRQQETWVYKMHSISILPI